MARGPSLRDDIKYAVRSISNHSRISVVTVIALGLGIGATTATISIVDGLFFRPLPGVNRSEQLVALYTDNRNTPAVDYGSLSYGDYSDHYRHADVFLISLPTPASRLPRPAGVLVFASLSGQHVQGS